MWISVTMIYFVKVYSNYIITVILRNVDRLVFILLTLIVVNNIPLFGQ